MPPTAPTTTGSGAIDSTSAIDKMNALTAESIAVNLASSTDQASEGMASAVSQTGGKVYQ